MEPLLQDCTTLYIFNCLNLLQLCADAISPNGDVFAPALAYQRFQIPAFPPDTFAHKKNTAWLFEYTEN